MDQIESLMELPVFKKLMQRDISFSKGFDELVANGAANQEESKLLAEAVEYIPKDKFESLIKRKANLATVAAEVAMGFLQRMQTLGILQQNTERNRNMDNESTKHKNKSEQDPSVSLLGILGALFAGAADAPSLNTSSLTTGSQSPSSSYGRSFEFERNKPDEEKAQGTENKESNNMVNAVNLDELGGYNAVIIMLFDMIKNLNNKEYEIDPKLLKVIENTPNDGKGLLSELASTLRVVLTLDSRGGGVKSANSELPLVELKSLRSAHEPSNSRSI